MKALHTHTRSFTTPGVSQKRLAMVMRSQIQPIASSTIQRRPYQTYSGLMKDQYERTGDSRILNMPEYHDLVMQEQELMRLQRVNKLWRRGNVVASAPIAASFLSDNVDHFIRTYAGFHPSWMFPATLALWVSWILVGGHYIDISHLQGVVHTQYKKLRETLDKSN